MNIAAIIIEGIFWSILWIISIILMVTRFPWLIEHDYPKDVREAANIGKPNPEQKRKGQIFTFVFSVLLFGLLVIFPMLHFTKEASYWSVFWHVWAIAMCWNIVDLVIVDWLMICVFRWEYVILKGTKDCKGNRDYGFHFIGFLKGFVVMSLFSLIMSGISYGLLKLAG